MLLTGGRRTALPRQQTLRATLDWSYELLSEPERAVLRRLAVFPGGFTLEAASTVVASAEIGASDGVDHVPDLVEKSLVVADGTGATVNYRLLETMRAYALDKLAQAGELEQVARRHAEYHRDLFERAESEWETRPATEWLADYGGRIDDVRTALDWAFCQTATRRSGSLSPPPRRAYGDSCRCRRSATGTSTERSRALHPDQSRRSAAQCSSMRHLASR